MTAKKTPRAPAPAKRAARPKAAMSTNSLMRQRMDALENLLRKGEQVTGAAAMERVPITTSDIFHTQPPAACPVTPVEMALDENTAALGRLHDALSVLSDRLERTVLPTAPPQATVDAASPSFGASPVLHRLTSLHAGIEGAASRVHSILGRLEA